jgi:hypothetical protein
MFMRAGKSWGVALFVVMSLTTLFITPAAADDLDAMSWADNSTLPEAAIRKAARPHLRASLLGNQLFRAPC